MYEPFYYCQARVAMTIVEFIHTSTTLANPPMAPSRSENRDDVTSSDSYSQFHSALTLHGGWSRIRSHDLTDKMHTELSQTLYQLSYRVSPQN